MARHYLGRLVSVGYKVLSVPTPTMSGARLGRIAVSGVAGFIGSSLAERLLAEGHEVVGIDCFAPDYPRALKERNIAGLAGEQRFALVVQDVCAPSVVRALRGCRAAMHLAGAPGVRTTDAAYLWGSNVGGTARFLESLRVAGVPRVIFASSSSVYGSVDRPVRERDRPAPVSEYGRTKLIAERACLGCRLEAVALRYFTVYGERQRPDMAFSAWIAAALGEAAAKLLAAGEHRRHFTFVGDAVEATVRALWAPAGRIYNVAGPRPAVVIDALRLIEEYLEKPVPVRRQPAFEGEAFSTNADLSAARRDLRWEPRVELAEGLRRQIDHALSERAAQVERASARYALSR